MAKTSGELEREFIDTSKERTGKTLQQWLELVNASGKSSRIQILHWLRLGHGLNHLQAQLIAGIHLNQGRPVYIDQDGLLESHLNKSQSMRALFTSISHRLLAEFPVAQLIPKKTYLSFTSIREFAAINIKTSELRLGLDLGDQPFTKVVLQARLKGPMPRISHMLIFTESTQFEHEAMKLVRESFYRTHKK
jgi:hypothetical protein